jgi:Bardet-Biedl syndrome 7 protein
MKLLPGRTEDSLQRVAIADHDGVITCFGMKRGNAIIAFKTLPGTKITCLELGGALGSARDRIFVCCGPEVRGFTKKGKQFFGFDTNLTESIQTMHISGSDLFLCGTYIYNHYQDCKDIDYYLSPDRINDVLYLNTERSPDPLPILACQDRMLRILRNSELLYECELVGPPRYLMLNNRDGGDQGDEVVYGTADGKVGLVRLTQSTPEYKWEAGAGAHHGGQSFTKNYLLALLF